MIKINGIDWRILLVSPNHPELTLPNGNQALGACNNNLKEVYVRDDLNNFYLKKVLCHELTHAAMFSYDVELNKDQEELVADLISTYGYEIIYTTNSIFNRLKKYR